MVHPVWQNTLTHRYHSSLSQFGRLADCSIIRIYKQFSKYQSIRVFEILKVLLGRIKFHVYSLLFRGRAWKIINSEMSTCVKNPIKSLGSIQFLHSTFEKEENKSWCDYSIGSIFPFDNICLYIYYASWENFNRFCYRIVYRWEPC